MPSKRCQTTDVMKIYSMMQQTKEQIIDCANYTYGEFKDNYDRSKEETFITQKIVFQKKAKSILTESSIGYFAKLFVKTFFDKANNDELIDKNTQVTLGLLFEYEDGKGICEVISPGIIKKSD